MKTYKQFVTEVVALAPLAIPVGKAIGAGLAATGLTGMIMQARKQGEGKRSQPVDYGQGGTATPRDKSVQRPTGRQPKASYRDQMRAKQRQERLERQKSVDSSTQRGPTAAKEAEKAAEARTKNDPRTSRLRGTIADRMAQGAKQNKLGEGMLPVPSDKRKRIINPMIAAMPPKTEKGINNAMKQGLDKLDKKMDRMYKDLNSVPKDREKA